MSSSFKAGMLLSVLKKFLQPVSVTSWFTDSESRSSFWKPPQFASFAAKKPRDIHKDMKMLQTHMKHEWKYNEAEVLYINDKTKLLLLGWKK